MLSCIRQNQAYESLHFNELQAVDYLYTLEYNTHKYTNLE